MRGFECRTVLQLPSRASRRTILSLCSFFGVATEAEATVRRVPQDYATIQAAINAAQDGDTVLVARGTYPGGLSIANKSITLASNFINTFHPDDINLTIIDGGTTGLNIQASAGPTTTVRGLTFRNGGHQVNVAARRANILDSRFINAGTDQVSFSSGGGLVRGCFFDNAGDDGIDIDGASDPTIENNTILNSRNDGIEMRLHDYTGATLTTIIRNNFISGAREDGIQLIDYAGLSSRLIRIERNVIINSAMVGLGSMANGISNEDFAGAPMQEEVQVINNTFSGNLYGLTGGDKMLVMNNIFQNSPQIGVKRAAGGSVVTENDFWNNGTDHSGSGSNVNINTSLFANCLLDANYELASSSPCINAGAASIQFNGHQVLAPPYSGTAPDLGARERGAAPGLPTVTVAATDASAAEGGGNPGTFTVSRTGSTTGTLTVNYQVGGTGTPGQDYTALSGSVTIASGAASAPINVAPIDDAATEASETVVVTLSSSASYSVGSPSNATVTIADNEPAIPTVTITVTDSVAAETGADPGTFTISRTGSTSSSLTVQYAITGNATNGVDYQTIGTSVSIAAGSATRLVTITPIDDSVVDGGEQAILTLTGNPAYVVGSPGSASLTIADNDATTGTTRSFQDGVSPTASYAGTKDAYISEPDQNSKFGTVNTLRVDGDAGAGKDISTLLKWDVSSIPPGKQVQAVRLSIHVTNRSAQPYQVFELKQPWVETQASWNFYSSGLKWSVAGAKGSQDRGSIVLGTVNASALGSYSLTLNSSGVALVQSWINTPSANQGIIITNTTSVDELVFSARNASTKAQRPKLTVTYLP